MGGCDGKCCRVRAIGQRGVLSVPSRHNAIKGGIAIKRISIRGGIPFEALKKLLRQVPV